MRNGLAAVWAGIDDEAIAFTQMLDPCDLSPCGDKVAKHGSVFREGFFCRGEVLLWNDQEMLRRLRVDVGEGEDELIFVDAIDRDSTGGNLAEDAVGDGLRGHG